MGALSVKDIELHVQGEGSSATIAVHRSGGYRRMRRNDLITRSTHHQHVIYGNSVGRADNE